MTPDEILKKEKKREAQRKADAKRNSTPERRAAVNKNIKKWREKLLQDPERKQEYEAKQAVHVINFSKRRTHVDPRLTLHPIKGYTICGSFKRHKRAEFETAGLTIEDLLNDTKLFLYYICCRSPLKENGISYDRCVMHQTGGRAGCNMTHGKYSKYLPKITLDEVNKLRSDGHNDLSEELSLIAKLIQDKVTIALGQSDDLIVLKSKLRNKVIALKEAILVELDPVKVKKFLGDLLTMMDSAAQVERAQDDLVRLLKDYTQIFDSEVKRRQASGEYVPKIMVIKGYGLVFKACAQFIPDEHKEAAEREVGGLITSGIILSLPEQTTESGIGNLIGFEDKDERSGISPIREEPSPKPILSGKPKISFVQGQ